MSVSGGKDSTALLLLARTVCPGAAAYRADGPARLQYSDRARHVAQLAQADGGAWTVCPYAWDVEAWLAGREPYRPGHKRRALNVAMRARGVDGVAMGVRAAESRGRALNAHARGAVYQVDWRLTCTPLVGWTAEEVLGYILACDRVPLNPIYTRTHLQPDPERLRDGSWMPRPTPDRHGFRGWLAYHYPEHIVDYDQAWRVTRAALDAAQ